MSISSTTRKAGPYTGNGSTTVFPFSFKVFQSSDVVVVKTDLSGAETTLVLTTDYTVSLNANQDSNPGGTITCVSAPATGYKITATSNVPELQAVTLTNMGGFYPAVLNDALDRLTIFTQQISEQVSRAVKTKISDSITPEQYATNLFNAEANAVSSAAAASTSATNAATSATNAANSATSASGSATTATTQASNASSSATAASGSASSAASSATSASSSATSASGSATAASTSASSASSSASSASSSATSAATSATSATNSLNTFRGQYYGALSADPALDPLGNPPNAGDLYFNSTVGEMRVYSGSAWKAGTAGTMAVQNFTGDGTTVAFTLPTAPAGANNTQVYIEGVYQQKNTYSIANTTLTFTVAPDSGYSIEVVTISTLALGNTDSALASYVQGGTGSVTRNVQDRLRDFVSVKDFGAVGDGVHDDTAAIQAVFSAANFSSAISKTVFFPAGTYLINSVITVNPNYINNSVPQIVGEGAYNTILKAGSSLGANPILKHQGGSPSPNTKWEGFTLRGTGAANGQYGIHHINTCFVNYDNLRFDALQEGIRFENVGSGFTEQNVITNSWCTTTKYFAGYRRQTGSTYDSFRHTGFGGNCHMDLTSIANARLIRAYNDTSLPPNLYDTPIDVSVWVNASSIVTQNDGSLPIRAHGSIVYEASANGWTLGSGSAADTFRGILEGISYVPALGTFRLLPQYSKGLPAFKARNSASQSITSAVLTKVVFDTEEFDTDSCFASNRFTPTVPGVYQFNTTMRFNALGGIGYATVNFYKNGSNSQVVWESTVSQGTDFTVTGSTEFYLNGTTDYVEVYAQIVQTNPNFNYALAFAACYFSGACVRPDTI